MTPKAGNAAKTAVAILPLLVVAVLLAFDISYYGTDAILGASQVTLLFAAGLCIVLGIWIFKVPWKTFENAMADNVKDITTAILILLMIGGISGTWTASGVIPAFIDYGVRIIQPRFFLVTACAICAIVSVMTGSSWTTIATIGVALLGIGEAEGFSKGLIAGAIISGSYFGDKISPLSDTTVLASSIAGTPLFTHIRYMLVTTVPSIVITMLIFTAIGLSGESGDTAAIDTYTSALEGTFNITPWVLIVPLVTAVLIALRLPALAVLGLSILSGAVAAVIFQPDIVLSIGDGAYFKGVVTSIYDEVSIDTGNTSVNELVASRGMLGMLNTVYLIICAMCFGGCMKAAGMIERLASLLRPMTRTRTGLVTASTITGIGLNGITSDQFLSIILGTQIYKDIYEKEGYRPEQLSRTVEDSTTVTSPLIPWSSCGMTQATILGVSTFLYAPFCFFNWISPLMTILITALGWKVKRRKNAG